MVKNDLPKHIAIIMDGNGRWAKKRRLPRIKGHKAGVDALKRTVEACVDIGIKYLTVFSFSSENWNRPPEEVSGLMRLFVEALNAEITSMIKNGIRLQIIGDRETIPKKVLDSFRKAQELTSKNDKLCFSIAISYGSRQEIVNAVKRLLKDCRSGEIDLENVNSKIFSDYLYTSGLPDPDLLIRTSGEYRISNFLLWQIAYSEFYFTDTLWPDFSRADLLEAINEYQKRNRRFGKV